MSSIPAEVAFWVSQIGGTNEMIMAAWLHDVVEDTSFGIDVILEQFGPTVARFVDDVTNKPNDDMSNRITRKINECKRLSAICEESQTIKIADIISNIRSIAKYDPKFAKIYLKEKEMALDVLTKGNPILWKMANQIIQENL